MSGFYLPSIHWSETISYSPLAAFWSTLHTQLDASYFPPMMNVHLYLFFKTKPFFFSSVNSVFDLKSIEMRWCFLKWSLCV